MPFLRIINPGFLTTIQDRGRFRYQKWGVPVAGAMDEYALRVANILAGNVQSEACLEITLLGPTVEFLAPGLVALAGADLGARLNGNPFAPWRSTPVNKGDVLQFAGIGGGCRAYLAVSGGFEIPAVMGSKSTYLRAGIGGLNGRALRRGDELNVMRLKKYPARARTVPADYRHGLIYPQSVRVLLGPQEDAFTREGIDTFLNSAYTVSLESDRMGCRLQGPVIKHRHEPDIISDGIAFGAIQVPGNGAPVVMMADRQTTGGYAKIAAVITPDLWKLAQAKPGDGISFTAVTAEQAYEEYLDYENRLHMLPERLVSL